MTTPETPPRHVVSFAQTLAGGGVERVLLRLAGLWLAAGWRVTLILGTRAGPLAAELPDGATVIEIGDPRYTALMAAAPALVARAGADVVFCPGNHYTAVAAWTRLRLGRRCPPIVGKVSNALERSDMGWLAPFYRLWLRGHRRFLDSVVAMTPGMADAAAAAMALPRADVHVIPNPPARPSADGVVQPLLPARYLLGVGRLAPQKRWDRAIAAFAALGDPHHSFVILGEGEERAALVAQVERLGLGGRVLLPGHVADPLPAIAGAAAVVLSSEFEGVPGVIREALAAGTPVVSTDSSVAVRELIPGPDHGTVVPVGDHLALVAALAPRLAPGAVRPAPVPDTGDPAATYLALFEELASNQPR